MHFQLRLGVTQRGERGDGGDFPATQIKPWPGVNIAEGELNQIAGEVGGDIPQAVDDGLPAATVHALKYFLTGGITFAGHRFFLSVMMR